MVEMWSKDDLYNFKFFLTSSEKSLEKRVSEIKNI